MSKPTRAATGRQPLPARRCPAGCRAASRTHRAGRSGLALCRSSFPGRPQAPPPLSEAPRPLPGSEGPLAAQSQEAAAEQRAAQRRGEGDDSPHGALDSGSRRSYGRPIVFKGGGGEGEAAMAAAGALRPAPPLARSPAPPLPARSRLGAALHGAAGPALPGALRARRPFRPASPSGGWDAGAGGRHGYYWLRKTKGRAVQGFAEGLPWESGRPALASGSLCCGISSRYVQRTPSTLCIEHLYSVLSK